MNEGTNIVIINADGKVLLYLRDDKPSIAYPNMWCLPGGYLEPDEEPAQCIQREIHEEMGVTLAQDVIHLLYSEHRSYGIEHTFWSEVNIDLATVELTEGQCLKWFTRTEIRAHRLGYEDHLILADFYARWDAGALT